MVSITSVTPRERLLCSRNCRRIPNLQRRFENYGIILRFYSFLDIPIPRIGPSRYSFPYRRTIQIDGEQILDDCPSETKLSEKLLLTLKIQFLLKRVANTPLTMPKFVQKIISYFCRWDIIMKRGFDKKFIFS